MAGMIPERSCLVCRRRLPKKRLQRFIRNEEGWLLPDYSGQAPGRGFYVCRTGDCLARIINRQKMRLPARFGIKGFAVRELAAGPEEDCRRK